MECFAFGCVTVRFASLETSFHAANHTIPPPPSYEGSPHCPKEKNRSPFHGEKPLMIKWFTGRRLCQISQTILHGRDAILRVCSKWLIFNIVSQLWADVKYRKHWKSRQGAILPFFFADYIWALPTFNNRWRVLFRCRWGAGVWWWGVGASGWFCGGFIEKKEWIICVIRLFLVT